MTDSPHLDETGAARMVDVGPKPATVRRATAQSVVAMSERTRQVLFAGEVPKGDAVAVARIAAIMGAKRTPDLIPLCHPLALTSVEVEVAPHPDGAQITVTAGATGPTGVEMEAMTAAALGAVALYDMIKGLERGAEIRAVRLLAKSGGRSGDWKAGGETPSA